MHDFDHAIKHTIARQYRADVSATEHQLQRERAHCQLETSEQREEQL